MSRSNQNDPETVTIEQIGEAIRRCAEANPEYTSQMLLHPDAEKLCEVLAVMNYWKINEIRCEALMEDQWKALLKWHVDD